MNWREVRVPKEVLTAKPEDWETSGARLGASIQRTLRLLIVTTVVLFLMIVAAGLYTYTLSKNNRDSLCIFRADIASRVQQTDQYLKEHPEPEPFPGITRQTLLTQVEGQKRTLGSFKHLHCPPFPKG
jgi:hypothetical protein